MNKKVVALLCSFVVIGFIGVGCDIPKSFTQSDQQALICTKFNVQPYQVAWTHNINYQQYSQAIVKMNDGSIWQVFVYHGAINSYWLLFSSSSTNETYKNMPIRLEQ